MTSTTPEHSTSTASLHPGPGSITDRGFIGLVITQLLGAFNDNSFKMVIIMYLIYGLKLDADSTWYISLATALFVLPFILFSNWCGWLADRHSKRTIVILAKWVEVGVMIFGLVAFYLENIPMIFFGLFLMGAQSTLFSPAKYGILPEILSSNQLSRGNGIIELTTFLAIIFGTAFGSLLVWPWCQGAVWKSSIAFIAIGLLGTVTAFLVPRVQAVGSSSPLRWNFLGDALTEFHRAATVPGLVLTLLAIGYFWGLGTGVQNNLNLYPRLMMNRPDDQVLGILFTVLALGIGIGAGLAGFLSGKTINFRLIPIGAAGMAIFLFDLQFSTASLWRTGFDLFMMGLSGGCFIVPLDTNLQMKAPGGETGRVIGLNNFVSNLFMVGASALYFLLSGPLHLDPGKIFIVYSGFCFLITGFIYLQYKAARRRGLAGASTVEIIPEEN